MKPLYKIFSFSTLIVSAVIIAALLFPVSMNSQNDDACLACHDDPDISMEKNGRKISLTVKKYSLMRSAHKKLSCSSCHTGYDPDAIPHKENIQPVSCMGSCHTDPAKQHPFHPRMAVAAGTGGSQDINCKGCHGYHEVLSPKDPKHPMHFVNSTEYCGSCHKSEMQQHVQSEHFVEVRLNNPDAPTCIFCHKNPVTKGYPINGAQLKLNQEKLCLHCHLKGQGAQSQFAKTLVAYDMSVHGRAITRGNKNAAVCIDCHGSHKLQKATNPNSSIHKGNIAGLCGKCHKDVTHEYLQSTHGLALKRNSADAPTCTYCHGEHNIQQIPDVHPRVFEETHIQHSTYVRNKMVFCVACHADKQLMTKYGIATVQEAHDWLPNQSVHWETVRCVDCHSSYAPPNLSHLILPPEQTIKKCEECHAKNSVMITKLYKHEKHLSRQKYGFINGTILSDAYVIGTTRNVFLDTASVVIFGLVVAGIFVHGGLRLLSKKRKSK